MPDRSYQIVLNPRSGMGAGARLAARLVELLEQRGGRAEVRETRPDRNVFRDVPGGLDGVVAIGGDGTLHEAVNGLGPDAPPLAFLGAGTVNVFSQELGLPRDAEGCARMLAEGAVVRLPLLQAGNRRFLLFLEAGLLGGVVTRVNAWRRLEGTHGRSEFVRAFLGAACSTWGRRMRVEAELDDGSRAERGPYSNVLITRARRYADRGRIPFPAGVEPLRDAGFTLVGYRTRSPVGHLLLTAVLAGGWLPRMLPLLRSLGLVDLLRVRRVRLLCSGSTGCHADAETLEPLPPGVEPDGSIAVFIPAVSTPAAGVAPLPRAMLDPAAPARQRG